eukprot:m.360986 g.360986  ORF g.360986 m.360986 type:complete len:379 (+) comp19264_c0_seq1:334-1470(+)
MSGVPRMLYVRVVGVTLVAVVLTVTMVFLGAPPHPTAGFGAPGVLQHMPINKKNHATRSAMPSSVASVNDTTTPAETAQDLPVHDPAQTCTFPKRHFLPSPDASCSAPPLLWSFPGSGNTFVRLLIEAATSIYTGSVYTDESLANLLPGEADCEDRVIAIKLHPNIAPFGGPFSYPQTFLKARVDCPNNGRLPKPQFDSAVIVMRHPLNAIWAEYQRFASDGNHTHIISKQALSVKEFNKKALGWARRWVEGVKQFKQLMKASPTKALLVKFEELTEVDTQYHTLARIVNFLEDAVRDCVEASHVSTTLRTEPVYQRVVCAFESPLVTQAKRSKPKGALTATEAFAYANSLCMVWSLVAPAATEFGYQLTVTSLCQTA